MITAKDIKTKGVKAIEEGLSKDDRLSVSFRGKIKYVILKADDYEHLRLAELEMAYIETMIDIEKGRFKIETADQHMDRLWRSTRRAN